MSKPNTLSSSLCLVAFALIAAIVFLPVSSVCAAGKARQVVLVLDSYHAGYDWSDDELSGAQAVFRNSKPNPVVLVEHLDAKRFSDKAHFSRLADLFAVKYHDHFAPEVVLAMDNAALEFATRYRPAIFPTSSIVFCGVNDFTPSMIAGQKKITGLAEKHNSVGTLELALRLFPKTKEVFLVHDYTETGLAMRNELSQAAARFPLVSISSLPKVPIDTLADKVKRLREGQLVMMLSYAADASGRTFNLTEAADIIAKGSPVPVFTVLAGQLDHGVLGGLVLGGKAHGEASARLVLAILQGKDSDSIPVYTGTMSVPTFDYRQLERFNLNINKTALPPGSILINTPKSSYQVNKAVAWFGVLLIATLALALVAVIINGRRQLAIRALKEANNAYRHLLDSVGDTVYIFDRDGSIIEANAAAAANMGYSHEELISLNITDLVAPDFVAQVSRRLQGIAKEGYALFESRHVSKAGTDLPLEVSAKVAEFRGESCIISINRDISARKETELELRLQAVTLEREIAERQQVGEQLRLERDNVRALFDAAPAGMLLINEWVQIVDSNSTMSRLIDKPIEEILGLRPGVALDCRNTGSRDATCGGASDCSACRLREAIRLAISHNVGTQGIEIRHVTARDSAENTWLRFSVEPVYFSGKKHALVAIDDVSEQRSMERQVRSEKERLAVTLASLGEGVITTDPQGMITLMNHSAESLTGWSTADALGKPLSQVFRLLRKSNRQTFSDLESLGGHPAVLEADGHLLLLDSQGGEWHITGTIAPMHDIEHQDIGRVLVFRDMTEQHELENELFQARKLESLGVLAGGLAHDLNNLLTAIIGNISIAELKAKGDQELQPFLSRALQASERTGDLTRQLLTFAKGGAPVKKLTSLQNIVSDSADFALRGSNIRCEYRIAEGLYPVAVDVGQMSQVINNLVINAKQAMPEGGILRIWMENVDGHAKGYQLKPGRYLKVTVQDQGTGIPTEHLERIFDPYFTTKSGGSGLGLASVHAIIAKHDGALKVESSVGFGTSVSFAIPASDCGPEKTEQARGEAFRGSGRILVMDDDPSIRETLSEMLQLIGYDVVSCDDGREALRLYGEAAQGGEPFRLAIMDLTIPGGLGGELAVQRLLQEYPEAKVIVASGYSDSTVMADYRAHGFSAAIAKPYTISVVSEVLRSLTAEVG
jgi:PAS domain S-box-containing protein